MNFWDWLLAEPHHMVSVLVLNAIGLWLLATNDWDE